MVSDVFKAANNNRYANDNIFILVKLGPIALFSKSKPTAGSGDHLEDISQKHIVPIKYKLNTSAENTDDFSVGFDRDRNRRQQELNKIGSLMKMSS